MERQVERVGEGTAAAELIIETGAFRRAPTRRGRDCHVGISLRQSAPQLDPPCPLRGSPLRSDNDKAARGAAE